MQGFCPVGCAEIRLRNVCSWQISAALIPPSEQAALLHFPIGWRASGNYSSHNTQALREPAPGKFCTLEF